MYQLIRHKDKILLEKTDEVIPYSYTRIPITDAQAHDIVTLYYSSLVSDGNTYYLYATVDAELFNRFVQRIKLRAHEHEHEANFEKVPNKKISVYIPGTSVLIRNTQKTCIWIARRRKSASNSTRCTINKIFITDLERKAFFDSVNITGGPDAKSGRYCLYKGRDSLYFKYWNDLMNNRYKQFVN